MIGGTEESILKEWHQINLALIFRIFLRKFWKLLSTFFFILIFFSYSQKYIKNYSYVFQYKILNLILHLSQIKLDPDFNKKNSLRIILNNLMKLLTLSIFMALLVLLVSLPLDPRPPLYIPPPLYVSPPICHPHTKICMTSQVPK